MAPFTLCKYRIVMTYGNIMRYFIGRSDCKHHFINRVAIDNVGSHKGHRHRSQFTQTRNINGHFNIWIYKISGSCCCPIQIGIIGCKRNQRGVVEIIRFFVAGIFVCASLCICSRNNQKLHCGGVVLARCYTISHHGKCNGIHLYRTFRRMWCINGSQFCRVVKSTQSPVPVN